MRTTGSFLGVMVQVLMWFLLCGGGFLFYSVFFPWQKALVFALV